MSTPFIERLIGVIRNGFGFSDPRVCEMLVRAILTEMRDAATTPMINAMVDAWSNPRDMWEAAIDAALKEDQ